MYKVCDRTETFPKLYLGKTPTHCVCVPMITKRKNYTFKRRKTFKYSLTHRKFTGMGVYLIAGSRQWRGFIVQRVRRHPIWRWTSWYLLIVLWTFRRLWWRYRLCQSYNPCKRLIFKLKYAVIRIFINIIKYDIQGGKGNVSSEGSEKDFLSRLSRFTCRTVVLLGPDRAVDELAQVHIGQHTSVRID